MSIIVYDAAMYHENLQAPPEWILQVIIDNNIIEYA